tara:strand:- start:205 stop:450 length:246 start_codon:yes stop_codon:yes gene_type:complete
MSDLKDLDRDELEMLSQYIQNQQQIINDLTERNMQLTTEVQVQRLRIKELEQINNVKGNLNKPKVRRSPYVLERLHNAIEE